MKVPTDGEFTAFIGIAPYDESTYLNALKRRGSPLLKQFEATT